jgi:hypothetical protein
MSLKKKKVKTRKARSFFFSNRKIYKRFIFRALFVMVSISIFCLIIYKAYNYAHNPADIEHIPLIKKDNKCVKREFEENDGLIFSNQDKIVYNSIKQRDKKTNHSNYKSESVIQDFSHKQIFDIVQDIKKDSADVHENDKSAKQKIFNKKKINKNNRKLNSSNKTKSNIKSIFEVLN